VAELVGRLLPASRYELETVQDGAACLRRLRAPGRRVDIVVLDLMLPVMSGYDVLRAMAFGGAGAGIPVLVLANVPEPATAAEAQLLRLENVVTVLPKTEVLLHPSALGERLARIAQHRPGAPTAPEAQAVTT
jgi:CheY-like chemotaxis protein